MRRVDLLPTSRSTPPLPGVLPVSCCLLAAALSSIACSDHKIEAVWDDSTIKIVAPADRASWTEGVPLTLKANLSVDHRFDPAELVVDWSSDRVGPLVGEARVEEGAAWLKVDSLDLGEHQISVTLTDPRNGEATDIIGLAVDTNTGPTISLTRPMDDAWFPADEPVIISGLAVDPTEPSPADLSLAWRLNGNPWMDGPGNPDDDGRVEAVLETPAIRGHTLSVVITDTLGVMGVAEVRFNVIERDADGDGYENEVLGGDDCDDTNPEVHPDATEVCDDGGIDEDCDGLVDDEDPDVEGQIEGYPDADGDGWGQADTLIHTCEVDRLAAVGDDCDDVNEFVNPDATEVCDDGLDNDCSGDVTECWLAGDFSIDVADTTLWGATAGDALSSSFSGGDWDGDGYADLVVSAVDAGGAGAAYLLAGPISPGALHITDTDHTRWHAERALDALGRASVLGHDIDGDGHADLILAADEVDHDRSNAGTVYLAGGPVSAGVGTLRALLEGDQLGGNLGQALDVGDVNCDGLPDLLAGEPGSDTTAGNAGAAHVVFGPVSATRSAEDAPFTLLGESGGDNLGAAVAMVGDVSGDGCDDLSVGAPQHDTAYANDGAVYLVLGNSGLAGAVHAARADVVVAGAERGEKLGESLGAVGDLDGAFYAELAVAAPRRDNGAGGVWVFHSPIASSYPTTLDIRSADIELLGDRPGDAVGASLHGGPDLEGDGCADLLIGAPGHTNDDGEQNRGAGFLVSCPTTIGSGVLDEVYTARFRGEQAFDSVGGAVRFLGDLTGDGRDDLGVGGVNVDGSDSNSGGLFVYRGRGE